MRIRVAELLWRVEGQRKDHKGDKKQRNRHRAGRVQSLSHNVSLEEGPISITG